MLNWMSDERKCYTKDWGALTGGLQNYAESFCVIKLYRNKLQINKLYEKFIILSSKSEFCIFFFYDKSMAEKILKKVLSIPFSHTAKKTSKYKYL